MSKSSPYRRILLKISGEALVGEKQSLFSKEACEKIAKPLADFTKKGIQVGVVIGGGNIFRGAHAKEFGFSRIPADEIGMLSTAINGIVLSQTLENCGCKARVMSALKLGKIAEPFQAKRATSYLEKGEVVIFVGGTGNPYFTTDTAAALRASEIQADVVLKGTKVDGVYDKDPLKFNDAKRYEKLSFQEALEKHLMIMDATAFALCRENHINIHVFNLFSKGALEDAIFHQKGGTLVTGDM